VAAAHDLEFEFEFEFEIKDLNGLKGPKPLQIPY
jgi:hypothetical protein